jgi:hypothetical protein
MRTIIDIVIVVFTDAVVIFFEGQLKVLAPNLNQLHNV